MKVIETVGKDIEEALNKGLSELDCHIDDVEVKILEHPGIFRKARVQFTYEGKDGRATIKTKADIMRNLEQRAAKDASASRQERRDKRSEQSGERRKENVPYKNEQRQVSQNADARKQAPVEKDNRKEGGNDKNHAPATERKNEFRSDFRSQLAAAQGENVSGKNTQTVQNAQNVQKNNVQPDRNAMKQPQRQAPSSDNRRRNEQFSQEELETAAKRADAYLGNLLKLMNVNAERDYALSDGEVNVELKTEDATVIGHRGETLDALEYLATLAAASGEDKYVHVNLDCGGYRAKRNEMLIESALAAAEKAVSTGKRVELEPMGSVSRRTIHAVLGNRSDVTTKSEGKEPNRYIVIIPRAANNFAGNRGKNNNRKKHKNGNRGNNRDRRNDIKPE